MTAPISNDLRERVVTAVLNGESVCSVATRFEFAASSVVKWSQRHRATGSVVPAKMGGYRKRILEPHRGFLAERLVQNPHLTLHGLKAELAVRGIAVSHNTIWEFIRSGPALQKKRYSLLNRLVPMSLAEESDGRPCSLTSILTDWSLLTRPGSRPRCEKRHFAELLLQCATRGLRLIIPNRGSQTADESHPIHSWISSRRHLSVSKPALQHVGRSIGGS